VEKRWHVDGYRTSGGYHWGPQSGAPARITLVNNSLFFAARADGFQELFKLDLEPATGDFNNDGKIDVADIDALTAAVISGTNEARFDLNSDQLVNQQDRGIWVEQIMKTWSGDADLDGQFNTHDLVLVFQRGEYEDGVAANSGWSDGDWNGDGEFGSDDLVTALQGGGYQNGPRAVAAVAATTESPRSRGPSSHVVASIDELFAKPVRRRSSAGLSSHRAGARV
jgi:hypothetical protein